MKKKPERHLRHEWDVLTVTHDGDIVWRRCSDRKIVTAGPRENPEHGSGAATARGKEEKGEQAMKCDRCGKETNVHIMSFFNEDDICLDCKEAEKQRPDYKDAVAEDEAAIKRGDYNFKGIGWKP
jgi:ribosomal protein L37E